jgi:hypothetical protein
MKRVDVVMGKQKMLLMKLPPVAIGFVVARVFVGCISDAYIFTKMAHVETYPIAKTNTDTMTAHLATPYGCTALAA